MPGPSDAQDAVENFRIAMKYQDAQASAQVVRAYAPVYTRLERDTRALVGIAQTRGLKPWQVMRMERLKDLERQFLANTSRFATQAGSIITDSQLVAVGLGRDGALEAASAGLPRGVTMENMANLGLGWNQLPDDAFQNFVGISADGAPLANLLEPLGPQAVLGVREQIGTGIALGKGPRETANLVRTAAGIPLSRALLITRTETNRAFRGATRLSYQTNSQVVKGYRRHADKSERTCMACIALDGTLYSLYEPLNEHPNGRCALVPEVLDYKDLGLDIPPEPRPSGAQDWFIDQSDDVQRRMLGATRYRAWEAGELQFPNLVEIQTNPVWGDMATVASVRNTMVGQDVIGQSVQIPLTEWIQVQDLMNPLGKIPSVSKAATPAAKRAQRAIDKVKAGQPRQVKPKPNPYTEVAEEFDKVTMPDPKSGSDGVGIVNENKEALVARGESHKELVDAVNAWSAGGNSTHREGAAFWSKGEINTKTWTANNFTQTHQLHGARIAEAASTAPEMPFPTFRGIKLRTGGQKWDNDAQGWVMKDDEITGMFKPGQRFDQHISSFSTDGDLAKTFANAHPEDATGLVFELESGARGLNVEGISTYVGEQERIVSGTFEVVGVRVERVSTYAAPSWRPDVGASWREQVHVSLRQVNTIVQEVK